MSVRLIAGGPFFCAIAAGDFGIHVGSVSSPDQLPTVAFPITGELDLHTFDPRDLGELIPTWIGECYARGFREVRIIHGKGTGTLRATVHALLRRSAQVKSFRLGDENTGSWGATLVQLQPA